MDAPTPKNFVKFLMRKEGVERREVSTRKGGLNRSNIIFFIFSCPKGGLFEDGGFIPFENGTGYSNPHRHLKTCLSNGNREHLNLLYQKAVLEARIKYDGRMTCYFPKNLGVRKNDLSMYNYMKYIALLEKSIYHIEKIWFAIFLRPMLSLASVFTSQQLLILLK